MEKSFQGIMSYISDNESKKTVGIVLKRIDLSLEQAKKENRDYITSKEIDILKSNIKEVIYEQYRNMRDFLQTGKIIFEFSNKSKE